MDKTKVLKRLKPKVASLGFNKKELWGIAEQISDNSDLEDDAGDEDIDAAIDAVLPYLKVGQQQANRLVNANKTTPTIPGDEDDDSPATVSPKKKTEGSDEEPEWFRRFREQQESRIAALEGEKIVTTRKSKLEVLLKDSGEFGKRELKRFSRMKFESDDEFDEYFSEVEEDLEYHNQELGNEALETLTKPVGSRGNKGKQETATDAEIEAIVANM
jgi:hypothetical protein|uniref:Uncharacterized protein n=1 Tax=Myoviridae sp. ctcPl3 TaxID=2826669 RepID=A0A8S5QXK4_9CAUD|nr:MAG TPA: hypothetical protein [Myoviridae sp. ctcPl3]